MAQIYGFYACGQARGGKFSAAAPPGRPWRGLGEAVPMGKGGRSGWPMGRHDSLKHVQRPLHACATFVARHDGWRGHLHGDALAAAWPTDGAPPGMKKPGKLPSFQEPARLVCERKRGVRVRAARMPRCWACRFRSRHTGRSRAGSWTRCPPGRAGAGFARRGSWSSARCCPPPRCR